MVFPWSRDVGGGTATISGLPNMKDARMAAHAASKMSRSLIKASMDSAAVVRPDISGGEGMTKMVAVDATASPNVTHTCNTPTNFSTSQSISLQHSYHSDTVFYIEKRNTYTANKKSVFSFIEDEDIKYSFALEKRALYALAYLRGR